MFVALLAGAAILASCGSSHRSSAPPTAATGANEPSAAAPPLTGPTPARAPDDEHATPYAARSPQRPTETGAESNAASAPSGPPGAASAAPPSAFPPSREGRLRMPPRPLWPSGRSRPSPLCRERARFTFSCWGEHASTLRLPGTFAAPEARVQVTSFVVEGEAGPPAPALESWKAEVRYRAEACFEEALVLHPSQRGTMTLHLGMGRATVQRSTGLDAKTVVCVRELLTAAAPFGDATVALEFEPGPQPPALAMPVGFLGGRLCHGRGCLVVTRREIELEARHTRGGFARSIRFGRIEDGVVDCWQRLAPGTRGELTVELQLDAEGHVTLARPGRVPGPDLDTCLARAVNAARPAGVSYVDAARGELSIRFVVHEPPMVEWQPVPSREELEAELRALELLERTPERRVR